MGYHGGKPIESVVYCFYKITLKNVSVFYEFTSTINHRFLTNKNARTMFSSYFINMSIRPRPHVSPYFLKSDIFSPSSERHTKTKIENGPQSGLAFSSVQTKTEVFE